MKITFWVVLALLAIFILVPVAMLFKESFLGEQPIPPDVLRDEIQSYLVQVPEEEKAAWFQEWLSHFDQEQLEIMVESALAETGLSQKVEISPTQTLDLEPLLASLSEQEKDEFEQALQLEVFLAKRQPLIFRLRPYITDKEFKRLSSGTVTVLTTEHFAKVFRTSYLLDTITRSLKIASVSMIFTVGVAYLFAFAINRTTVRFKGFFNAMMLLPLVSPPVIMAFALIMLFGRRGLITNGLLAQRLHLIDAQTTNIYGMHGVVLAQMLTYGPVAFVVLHSVLAELDTRIEEAAENLGASRWQTFLKVTLPMSLPGLFRAALITFASCLQDFGNPRIIGGELTMIAGVMYDQMISLQNPNVAAVLGIILLLPSIIAFIVGTIFLSRRSYASSEPGGLRYVKPTPRWTRRIFEVLCLVFSILVLVLYVTIVWGSFVKVWGYDNTLTLDNYRGVTSAEASYMEVEPTPVLPLLFQSVKTMAIAGGIGGLFALVAGYVLQRTKTALSDVGGYLIMLTVALPGVVFGIGYILTFNAPFGIPALGLTGTSWIIVLLVIFTRMYGGVLPTQAVLQKVDESVEEAAISLGATRIYTFTRVIFPALSRPWLLGSLYIFVSGLVALSGVIFLQSAGHKLMSIEIFLNASGGRFGLACVQSTYLILVVLVAQAFIRYMETRKDQSGTR